MFLPLTHSQGGEGCREKERESTVLTRQGLFRALFQFSHLVLAQMYNLHIVIMPHFVSGLITCWVPAAANTSIEPFQEDFLL